MREMARRVSRTYRLEADLVAGLEQVSQRDGVPVSTQVRRAIRDWLERRGVVKAARSARRKRTKRT